jgi:hypothetical protein
VASRETSPIILGQIDGWKVWYLIWTLGMAQQNDEMMDNSRSETTKNECHQAYCVSCAFLRQKIL